MASSQACGEGAQAGPEPRNLPRAVLWLAQTEVLNLTTLLTACHARDLQSWLLRRSWQPLFDASHKPSKQRDATFCSCSRGFDSLGHGIRRRAPHLRGGACWAVSVAVFPYHIKSCLVRISFSNLPSPERYNFLFQSPSSLQVIAYTTCGLHSSTSLEQRWPRHWMNSQLGQRQQQRQQRNPPLSVPLSTAL
jgi:hypothetical protein